MATKTIIAEAVEVIYEDDNIFQIRFLYNSNISLKIAEEVTAELLKMAEGMDFSANLVDVRDMTFIDGSARKHFAAQANSTLKAVAIVINSKFQTALANLYFKIAKPVTETRLFSDKEEAMAWLNLKLNAKYARKLVF